ncbi:MAG: YdcF family protein [Clostridia bacterium]|nr:YdcF family protein [Clostridia bacterium]
MTANCGRRVSRVMVTILSFLLLTWAILPVFVEGTLGVGVLAPLLLAVVGLVWGFRRPAERKSPKGWKRIMTVVLWVLAAAIAVTGIVCTVLMHRSANRAPAEGATVVVLGSKIHSDQPSRMLGDRLRIAADYLRENPEAKCVVSGGLGDGETYTEAYVMKYYLVNQEGIDPDRIATEDESTNTHENLAFSMDIIRDKGWSTHVVTATQIFHQYRAGRLAMDAGADSVGAVACRTPFHLMLYYWARECAAICRLWVLGY